MALQRRELYVCLGAVILIYAGIAWRARRATKDTTTATAAERPVMKKKRSVEPSEGAISLATLRTLVGSPDPSIATAATSIAVTRFARLPEANYLLRDDALGPDPEISKLAVHAVKFLRDQPSVTRPPVLPPSLVEPIDNAPYVAPPIILDPWSGFGYFDSFSDEWTNNTATSAHGMEMLTESHNAVAGWTNVTPEQGDANTDSQEARRRRRMTMVVYEDSGDWSESDI